MGSIPERARFLAAALLALGQLMTVGAASPVAAAGEIRVDVCLTDSTNSRHVPGTTSYQIGIGPISYFSSTVDPGSSCKYQLFAAGTTNVTIWTTFNNTTSAHLTQDIAAQPRFDFQTRQVTVRVEDAAQTGVAGAQVRYGGILGTAYYYPGQPTGAGGELSAELFPGTYTFRVDLNYTFATKTQDVGADPLVVFTTTTLTLGYSGIIAFGGATGDSAFFTPHSRELFPGTVNFRFDFSPGGPIRLPILIDGVPLTKSMIVARLLDAAGMPIQGVAVTAEPGGISLGATDANGVAYALVDGTLGSETVSFTYGGGTFVITQNQPTNSVYRFTVNPQTPPLVTDVIANSMNPIAVTASGATLTATVDDTTTGNSNIASAEYSIDGGAWTAMAAVDGSFDSPTEDITATIPVPTSPVVETICVRGTDNVGNTSDGTACTNLVVYDPSGGFVTGGGWILSPTGACQDTTVCVDATGKANFGFVSKYKKGASVPDGNTQFVFQAGSLNFSSTSYQWLVVSQSGTNAQYKGSGTINGAGSYGFMIWATQGSPDTFRIKITDSSDNVVYDDADTPLGGGSIIVHTAK